MTDQRHTASEGTRPLTAQGEDRRAAIVEAARRLFGDRGYAKTRMTDISNSAGVTKGLLYWYFENKEALILEILRETRERLVVELGDALSSVDDALEQLLVSTATATRFIRDNYRLYRVGETEGRSGAAAVGRASLRHARDAATIIERGQQLGSIRDGDPLTMAFANAGVVNNLCAASFHGSVDLEPMDLGWFAAAHVTRACAARDDQFADLARRYPIDGPPSLP